MHNFLKLAVILGIFTSLTTGCSNHATGGVNPGANLSAQKTMFVQHYASDNSGVNELIANKLRNKGVTVTTGDGIPPSNVDAVVTYVDRWMWDITMYMLELTINISDSKTGFQMATGNSLHTSLTRKSQTDMVDEVVNSIYNSPNNTTSPSPSNTPTPQPNTISQHAPAPALTLASTASETPATKSLSQKLQELKVLRENGTITESEYKNKRKQLIDLL